MKSILASLLLLVSSSSFAPVPEINSENGNRFAFSMVKILSEENKGNFVFSPYSLRNCFAYAYAGAANSTKQQIQNTFLYDQDPEKELKTYQYSNSTFKSCHQSNIKIANSIWIKQNTSIGSSYRELTGKYTDDVKVLKSAQEVNGWVSEKTNGEIKELVSQGEVNQSKVMLLNALTLDAQWKFPFKEKDTYAGVFFIGNTKTFVPTMTGEISGNYFEDKNMKLVQMAYKDDLSMTIIMPQQEKFVLELNDKMQKRLQGDMDMFGDLNLWGNEHQFLLHLPKFEVTSTINMVPPLMNLGITDAFSDNDADFSKINSLIYLELVKQIAKIEVNETGTKASAATVIGMVERGIPPTYKIDKPFYFIVHHNKTGEILFMGKIVNP